MIPEARDREPTPATLVVCDDDGTLLRLREYLTKAGFSFRGARKLADAWRQARSCASMVLMADDFDTGEVVAGMLGMLARPPKPFVVIVTSARRQLEPIALLEQPGSVVIIPRPAWGWTIVDLLRGRRARSE